MHQGRAAVWQHHAAAAVRIDGHAGPRLRRIATVLEDDAVTAVERWSTQPHEPPFFAAAQAAQGHRDITAGILVDQGNEQRVPTSCHVGRKVGAGSIEIRFTLPGDTDLNGTINTADFTTLAANFNQPGLFWPQGDFNYDGVINALDFNALASNFGQSLAAPALGALVPEPASIGALLLSSLMVRRRSVKI